MPDANRERFLAAAVQLTSTADLRANLELCRELSRQAADKGARVIILPECFVFLGVREADKLAVAEKLHPERPGPIFETISGIAREHRLWLIAGGLPERLADSSIQGRPEVRKSLSPFN